MMGSLSLHLLLLFLLLSVATIGATTFNIINRCSFTVWPATMPVGGGMRLDAGESWTLDMPDGTTNGRVWPRTGCTFDSTGNGSCQTGDCGGVLSCTGSGQPPNTMAEFSLAQFGGLDFFDISIIDGFNVPMDFLPVPTNGQGRKGCTRGPRCPANIALQCPAELKAPGGCNNACTVFKQDEYCCTGANNRSCEATDYSAFFKQMCPDVYSYPQDDASSTFTCPSGTNYQVVFCPPINISALALPPAANPPSPIAIGPTQWSSSLAKSRNFGVILGSVGGFAVLVILITFVTCKLRTRQRQQTEEQDEEFGELQGIPTRFTFQQLQEATSQFRDKLGEGGFGSKSHRLLVYEYMPKGSLDRWIYYRHDNIVPPLDWQTRHKIITNIAKGLSYLHEDCMKKIAHLDVKPQNILLDENFNAKLSDFGLCKLIDRDKSQVITRMRGTPGYLAPEWLTSQITEKADVYSFGVVVMEIISGRKNLDPSRSEESIHLVTLLEEKIDCKRRPQMSEVVKVLEGNMDAETNIDHKFVATSQAIFCTAENIGSSGPPVASDLSGPR
ncbi:hypothetical protein ACP70R_019765 [Stipagrostis hirtigluma subsp. patula]